jgi:hypothetical protein
MQVLNKSKAGGSRRATAADAPAIREIMNGLGVDASTAQAIWKKENGITGGNQLTDILQQSVDNQQQ